MRLYSLVLVILFSALDANQLYDDELPKQRVQVDDVEFEPLNVLIKAKKIVEKNINCDDFSLYTLNCTLEAAMNYNSSRKSLPMPAKIGDWCRAIRQLTDCAVDWNSECKDVTESHFNEDGIKGHMHVLDNICDDEWFLGHYDDLSLCIEATDDMWEGCYSTFKVLVYEQKNKSMDWSHYKTHFYMCCARAQFRRCTLDSLFGVSKCSQEQSSTLQKFSIIVSEGEVYQDCDTNMMYSNCPGGDPRPSRKELSKLVTLEDSSSSVHTFSPLQSLFVITICIVIFFRTI